MKRLITLLLSCLLALGTTAIAQQDQEQQTGKKQEGEKPHKEAHQKATHQQANQQAGQAGQKQHGEKKAAGHENAAATNPEATPGVHAATGGKGKHHGNAETNATAAPETNANANVNASPNANVNASGRQGRQAKRQQNRENRAAKTNAPASPAATAAQGATENQQAATANQQAATANTQANTAGGGRGGKKLDAQKIQTIKSQHASFRAQPRPDRVPAVTFNQSYRISGAEHWQGPQYEVFRSYHPERHDQGWYRSHFSRVELIGGGYYYWNNGYWYPAWGYSPSEEYYAWDGPIYVGHRAEPPDRVIADVQAALQEEGYYRGEVDGLLGPLTREALSGYQADHGLLTTAAIDEPTLDSLGMG